MRRNTRTRTTQLKSYRETIVNRYSSKNFDAQFTSRISALHELFNYSIQNPRLQGIRVTGHGKWIKVWVDKYKLRRMNPRSQRQLENILNKHLYPERPYRWGYFRRYIALGPRTVMAGSQWGGNNNYEVFRVH